VVVVKEETRILHRKVDLVDHKVILQDQVTLVVLLMAVEVVVVPVVPVVLELHMIVHCRLVEVVLEGRFLQHLEIQYQHRVHLQQHLHQVEVV